MNIYILILILILNTNIHININIMLCLWMFMHRHEQCLKAWCYLLYAFWEARLLHASFYSLRLQPISVCSFTIFKHYYCTLRDGTGGGRRCSRSARRTVGLGYHMLPCGTSRCPPLTPQLNWIELRRRSCRAAMSTPLMRYAECERLWTVTTPPTSGCTA